MVGVEIDMVVADSLKTLGTYERIFEIERIEVSDFPQGENEVVFSLYGVRFHMLDENSNFELRAPNLENPVTIWFNIMVEDIKRTYEKALQQGCTEVQPLTEMPDYGVSNAIFMDPFGYQWMLHEIHEEVSHEERLKLWEEEREKHQ